VFIQPFARKGRRRERKANRDQTSSERDNVTAGQGPTLAPAFEAPHQPASAIEHGGPKQPKEDHVNDNRNALDPDDPFEMIRQKLRLDQKQQKDGADNQREPGDRL
jgi:hypothetical protein